MAAIIPPYPIGEDPQGFAATNWYITVRNAINGANNISWASIDKSGSNLNELQVRLHNDLQTIQGGAAGDFQHLTTAQVTSLSGIGKLAMVSAAADPTNTDIAASKAELWKNTTSGLVKLWVNDGGTMKSVLLT